jgi:DNA polymerase-3 subunit delta
MTIFFYGQNSYALKQQLAQMSDAYLQRAGSDFGLVRLDGTNARLQELAAALRASPFLATSRLVVVEGLALNKALASNVAELLGMVPKTTVAVFIESQVDQRTASYKALVKADKVVKFDVLTGSALSGWIKSEVALLGGTITPAGMRELMDLAGTDQWRLAAEINKLVNYRDEVTEDTVRLLVSPSVERSIFKLVEAMTAGKHESALTDYHGLLRQRENVMMILTMIQWHLRNLLYAKSAPPSMSGAELAKAAGMSPYVAEKSLDVQGSLSADIIKNSYRAAAECEFDIKTGRIPDEVAVERLIYGIAVEAKRR